MKATLTNELRSACKKASILAIVLLLSACATTSFQSRTARVASVQRTPPQLTARYGAQGVGALPQQLESNCSET